MSKASIDEAPTPATITSLYYSGQHPDDQSAKTQRWISTGKCFDGQGTVRYYVEVCKGGEGTLKLPGSK